MKFSEVIDALMEYKPISRTGWADDKFLYLDKEQNWFAYHLGEDTDWITYILYLKPEDIIADDWKIAE